MIQRDWKLHFTFLRRYGQPQAPAGQIPWQQQQQPGHQVPPQQAQVQQAGQQYTPHHAMPSTKLEAYSGEL